MADIVNLRNARKQARRKSAEQKAQANRLAHGRPSAEGKRDAAQQAQAKRQLDQHRIH